MANLELLRDSDPEARALGGWFVRITEGSKPLGETDYFRTRYGAIIAGLGLAFRLGVDVGEAKKFVAMS